MGFFNGLKAYTPQGKHKIGEILEAQAFSKKTRTPLPSKCWHHGEIELLVNVTITNDRVQANWGLLLEEVLECNPSAYEIDGWSPTNSSKTALSTATTTYRANFNFAKICNGCNNPGMFFNKFTSFGFKVGEPGWDFGPYKSLPDWAQFLVSYFEDSFLEDFEADILLTHVLAFLEDMGVDDPQKKGCEEVAKGCKKGGGDPFT